MSRIMWGVETDPHTIALEQILEIVRPKPEDWKIFTAPTVTEQDNLVGKDLRSISWHSDGRVMAKSGAGAKHPRKIYSAKTPHEALTKLIKDNREV